MRFAFAVVLTFALGLVACGSDDAGNDQQATSPFQLTIPPGIKSLDDALSYVRTAGEGWIKYKRESPDDPRIVSVVGGDPGTIPPQMLVVVFGDSRQEGLQQKVAVADDLRRLFDRWDLCDIDIGWNIVIDPGAGASPKELEETDSDPLDDRYVSPGCDGPVFTDEERFHY